MTPDYATLKIVHQAAVALSLTGFFARGIANLVGARWVQGRGAKTLPHVVDTVLLVSALGLLWTLKLSPIQAPWVMAKIAGLVLYIVLGALALRPGRSVPVRAAFWVAALATAAWIVSVAMTKRAAGFLA